MSSIKQELIDKISATEDENLLLLLKRSMIILQELENQMLQMNFLPKISKN